jgi:hypothetical protein
MKVPPARALVAYEEVVLGGTFIGCQAVSCLSMALR